MFVAAGRLSRSSDVIITTLQCRQLGKYCVSYAKCSMEECAMRRGATSGSIRQDRVELAAAGWLIAWELLIGCGV